MTNKLAKRLDDLSKSQGAIEDRNTNTNKPNPNSNSITCPISFGKSPRGPSFNIELDTLVFGIPVKDCSVEQIQGITPNIFAFQKAVQDFDQVLKKHRLDEHMHKIGLLIDDHHLQNLLRGVVNG